MKTNIKMRVTPEQSRRVQEICFENGIEWLVSCKLISYLPKPYLIIEDSIITYRDYGRELEHNINIEEIDADLFIRTNGTCEEKISEKIMKENTENTETFIKKNNYENISDLKRIIVLTANKHDILEIKLKKKNEILKKARIKRKNQREELNKLNLKLQKCISLEEHDLKMKTVLNEKHKLEAENTEMGKLVNLNKSALDLVVMTKELAMNEIERKNNEIEKLKVVIEYLVSKVK